MGEGSSTEDLVPKQALVPRATMPVVPRFWAVALSDQVARRGLAASSRAHSKAPTVQVESAPSVKIDVKLACWF